jgi:hypothetical protein
VVKRFLVLLAACGAAPVAPADQPIIYAPSVVVRLADRQDVFPKPSLIESESLVAVRGRCVTIRGSLAPELYQPILTYVRSHLVRVGNPHAQLISDDPGGDVPEGVSILIAPRNEIGELRIENHNGSSGSGNAFCMHVRHDGNRTLIILEPAGEWIT